VWEELERRGAAVAVVPFSGRAGDGGRTGTVTLRRLAGGELVHVERWRGREELAFALEGPVWDRYGQFAGHPLIRWTVTWTVADRRIQIVAIIGATRYYLTLDIENLDARDPDRRPIAILLLLVRRGGMLLPYGVRRHES
jgi:hypothetical protein